VHDEPNGISKNKNAGNPKISTNKMQSKQSNAQAMLTS